MKRFLRLLLAMLVTVLVLAVIGFFAVRTPDIPHQELVSRYGDPPSFFLDLPSGARAHVRDQGHREGVPLLLVHGSNASLHTWEPWAALLGDTYRIVSVDLPGHGLTGAVPGDDYSTAGMVRFLEELRQALSIDRWHIAGNSMGGHVAWRYAVRYPERVGRLVLVDAAGLRPSAERDDGEERGGSLAFRLAATPGVNLLLEQVTPRGLVEEGLRAAFFDQTKVTEAMLDRYYELLLHPGNRRATRLRFSRLRDGEESAARPADVDLPTLVLSGEEDRLVPVAVARRFHEEIADSELVTYPDVGHIPMEEIPERSASDVRAFLAADAPPETAEDTAS